MNETGSALAGTPYRDPRSRFLQRDLGLTERQIVLRARRMGLRTAKIYGRYHVAADDVDKLKETPNVPQTD